MSTQQREQKTAKSNISSTCVEFNFRKLPWRATAANCILQKEKFANSILMAKTQQEKRNSNAIQSACTSFAASEQIQSIFFSQTANRNVDIRMERCNTRSYDANAISLTFVKSNVFVSIMMALTFSCHTKRQKSFTVSSVGPCVTK